MSDWHPPARPRLSAASTALRLVLIAVVVVGAAGAFFFAGGAFSPDRLTQGRFLALFHAGGAQPGFRYNHAKGICVTGTFTASGSAAPFTTAAILTRQATTPVIGRFALAGPTPFQADSPKTIRSLGLRFLPPDGAPEWRTGMNAMPVFVSRTAQGFYDLSVATAPDPHTGKPDPARVKAFLDTHPDTAAALPLVNARPITSGFADSTYNSLDAFLARDSAGHATAIRWSVVPVGPVTPLPAAETPSTDKNALFDAIPAAIAAGHATWHLVLTLADPTDQTADPTLAWPPGRRTIDAGTLTLDHAQGEDNGACRDVNYDPTILPPGLETSDDPILAARSAVYAGSFTARAAAVGGKKPSAVTPAEATPQSQAQPAQPASAAHPGDKS